MFGRVVHQFTYFNIVFINMYMDTQNDIQTDRFYWVLSQSNLAIVDIKDKSLNENMKANW